MKFRKNKYFFITVLTILLAIFMVPTQSLAESSGGTTVQSEVRATFVRGERGEGNGTGGENNITEDVNDNLKGNNNEDSNISEDNENEEGKYPGNQGLFPQTGDFFDMRLMVLGLISSFTILMIMLLKSRKKQKTD